MIKDYRENKELLRADMHRITCNNILTPKIQQFISKLVKPPTYQLTLSKICSQIKEVFGVEIKRCIISKFLKNKLNYVF